MPGRVYRRDDLDSDALAGVRADRGPGGRRRYLARGSEGDAARLRAGNVFARRRACAVPAELLPRTPNRAPRWTSAAGSVTARGCAMCKKTGWIELGRLRNGASGGVRGRRIRRRNAIPGLRAASASSASPSCATRCRTSGSSSRTISGSSSSFPYCTQND